MRYVVVVFVVLSAVVAYAQHCPFDGAGIIAIRPLEESSSTIIPNLRITLLDSVYNVVFGTELRDGAWVTDTVEFWQNPQKTTFRGYIDNANPADGRRIRFPFARDNYVWVCSDRFPAGRYYVQIEDIDGKENGGAFKTLVLSLRNDDVYTLCSTYDEEEYPESGEGRRFEAVEITLLSK